MTAKETVIYHCDFCSKKLQRKHAMVHHEMFCPKNPDNFRPCYKNCKYYERDKVAIECGDNYAGEPQDYDVEIPFCTFHQKGLISLTAKRKGLPQKYPWTFQDQIEMPRDCKEFDRKEYI